MRFLLLFVDLIHLDLSPYKKTILSHLFTDSPPKPSFDETFYHVAIISISNKAFLLFKHSMRNAKIDIDIDTMS